MQLTAFSPVEIAVAAGTTVTWTNLDSIAHTTTSEDAHWDSGSMSPRDTFELGFAEPGTYDYFCAIHPGSMRATVIVSE